MFGIMVAALPAAGAECSLSGTTVTGNLTVGKAAQLLIFAGTIYGNLQCARSTPGVIGGSNTVTSSKQGQCAGF
jgi:hypothetical protein